MALEWDNNQYTWDTALGEEKVFGDPLVQSWLAKDTFARESLVKAVEAHMEEPNGGLATVTGLLQRRDEEGDSPGTGIVKMAKAWRDRDYWVMMVFSNFVKRYNTHYNESSKAGSAANDSSHLPGAGSGQNRGRALRRTSGFRQHSWGCRGAGALQLGASNAMQPTYIRQILDGLMNQGFCRQQDAAEGVGHLLDALDDAVAPFSDPKKLLLPPGAGTSPIAAAFRLQQHETQVHNHGNYATVEEAREHACSHNVRKI